MENSSNKIQERVSLLCQARLAADYSIHQLAETTKIPARYIQALESYDQANYPSKLFVMGYLRNCANLLNIDIDALLEDYPPIESNNGTVVKGSVEVSLLNRRYLFGLDKHQIRWLFGSFAGTVAVVFLVFFLLTDPKEQDGIGLIDSRPQYSVAPLFTDSDSLIKRPNEPSNMTLEDQASSPADVNVHGDELTKKSLIADEVLSHQEAEYLVAHNSERDDKANLALLELEFQGASWVELSDAKGQQLYRDLAKKGSKLTFSAHLPMKLLLGNGPQVNVFLNSQPFAIQGYRDDNSVRLVIDAL